LFITSHIVDGNCPVNKLVEMFNTCRGRLGIDDGSSCTSPLRRLKLTSRTVMLLDDISSDGRPPDSKLWDRLRCSRPLSMPKDAEIWPFKGLGCHRDICDCPISATGNPFPGAAIRAVLP
jgi:hypothetical protein